MALTELVSNLSVGLYGAPTPSQFVMPIGPGSSNTPTDAVTFATTNNGSLFYIQNSGNGISRRIVQGFNNLGYLAFFGNKQSKDNYPLFTALGENGTSRRMNQGGYGFPFPSSPITGDSFDWKPESHTGWNINNRYNDTINKSSTSGLADTYTTNSPNLFSTFQFPLFTALGLSGTATLQHQGGYGFPFKSVATGNVYDWKPNAHTGWNINNRYSDTIKNTLKLGLADTYTTNSPNLFSTFRFPLGGDYGEATLENQGGIGFPFPIGPTGNVYKWKPNAHTGWNINKKYNDNINRYGTSGLADTYTTNSPIDDIYNKVKVRSEAWNRNSFGPATDQPFILRGIQRDNNSDPQYWGAFNNPNMNVDTISDTPRGGLLTAIEREAIDKVRIGKFLISPKGIFFAAKQLGLQASNPNVEGPDGSPSYNPIFNTKLWNPLSLFSLNTPVPYHITRHGIPGDPTGLSAYSYEKTVTTERGGAFSQVVKNRLVKLESEAFGNNIPIGSSYNTLGGLPNPGGSQPAKPYIGGPKSFLGLGFTNQRRYTDTSLRQSSLKYGAPGLNFVTNPLSLSSTNVIGSTYDSARYTVDNPYITRRGTRDSPKYTPRSDDSNWSKTENAKLRKIIEDSSTFPMRSKVLENNQSTPNADKGKEYSTLAYGDIRDTATNILTYNDFRKSTSPANFKSFIGDPYNTAVDYTENNLFKKYGIPEYGAAGLDRSDPTKPITATTDNHLDITNIDTKDLIEFTLQSPEFGSDQNGNALKLKFRAYISSISDSWSVQTTNLNTYFLNQALNTLGFDSTSRSISIDMTIPILAKADLVNAGNNLDLLARTMYGKGSSGKRRLPAMLLRIGNYTGTTVILTSLSYDIDNETPWDIDNQTPMVVQVSMQFTEQDNAYTDGIRHGRVSTSNTLVYF